MKVAGSSRVDFPPVKEPQILDSGSLTHACVLIDLCVVDTLNRTRIGRGLPSNCERTLCTLKSEAE